MKKADQSYHRKIDCGTEIDAVSDWLRSYWDTDGIGLSSDSSEDPVRQLVSCVFNKAHEDSFAGIALLNVGIIIGEKANERRAFLRTLKEPESEHLHSDGLMFLVDNMFFAQMNFSSAVNDKIAEGVITDIVRQSQAGLKDVLKDIEGLKTLKPKDYDAFTQNYTEYKGMAGLDEDAINAEFAGHHFPGAISMPLPMSLSLPHIAYDDIEQGRSPLSCLLLGIYYQGFKTREHNNTCELVAEIDELGSMEQPFINRKLEPGPDQFQMNRFMEFKSESIDQSYEPMTEEIVRAKARKKAEYDALSDEEKSRRKAAAYEEILKTLEGNQGPGQ